MVRMGGSRLTPHGVSGLKLIIVNGLWTIVYGSHPAWGEWIEIIVSAQITLLYLSHPAWGEWIEMAKTASMIF